jgi:hypothetical protein
MTSTICPRFELNAQQVLALQRVTRLARTCISVVNIKEAALHGAGLG